MTFLRIIAAILLGATVLSGCNLAESQYSPAGSETYDSKAARRDEPAKAAAPRIAPMTYLAAGQMLERQGDPQGAIEQYEKAIAANPRFTTAYNRLGIVYQRLGKLDEAENILRQGLRADPDAAVLHNNIAYCLLIQNRLVEAEEACRQALRASPQFKRARMNLAITLARANRLDESIMEFSQVVAADVARYNVGVIRLDERDYMAAEKAFRGALALNPDCPGAQAYLDRTLRLAAESAYGRETPSRSTDTPLAGQMGSEAPVPSP